MISVQILEGQDTIQGTDWCRPLILMEMDSGSVSYKNPLSGTPENNMRWVMVKDLLWEGWIGRTVEEYNHRLFPHEFVRGPIPKEHQLCMKSYSTAMITAAGVR